MEPRKNIEKELMELSPVLAQNWLPTPYQVPPGYFEQFAESMLKRVLNDESSSVLPVGKENPYSIPTGYFDGLADAILNRIKASEADSAKDELEFLSPVLGKLKKENPYTLPEGYFEELASNVTDGAKAIELVNEELENLSPLMNSLKNKNVFEVPQGYFETLPDTILSKAKEQKPAKVVSMNFGRKLMRYASAAVVAGFLFMGGWMYLGKGGSIPDPAKGVKELSDSELQEYVENQSTGIDNNESEVFEIDANDVKDMLADVSDEELQQYVEQSAEGNNTITN